MARPKRETPWFGRRGDKNNGIFYAFWYNADKRAVDKVSLATSRRDEAEVKFADFLLNSRDIRAPRSAGELKIARALDDYYEEHVLEKCAAHRRQAEAIAHLKEFFGDRPVSAVDIPASVDYANARKAGRIGGGRRCKNKVGSPSTIRRELNVLVAAVNHARKRKRTTVQPFVELPPEKRLGQDDEAPYYTREELKRIFDEASRFDIENDTDVEPFIRLLYQTGARRKSIETLTRDQVKMDTRRILLQKPGKKATKKRQPIVPILTSMEPGLKSLMAGNAQKLFEQADYYRHYRKVAEAAGIDEDRRHPHIMRHTRATHLLQDGKSIYDVAKLLGDTIRTVEQVYGHHSAEHLASRLED